MRICLLCTSLLKSPPKFGGAIETFTYELGKSLAKLNNKVILVTRNGFEENRKVNSNLSIISLKIPSNPFLRGLSYNLKTIKTLINQKSLDILHTQGTANFVSAFFLSKCLRIPIIHTEHVYHPWIKVPFQSIIKRIKYPFELVLGKFALNRVKKIIVSTELMKKSLEHMNPKIQGKLEIIPQGINPELFNHQINSQYLRKKYNYSKIDKLILYVGRIIPEKNIEMLMNAFKELKRQFKNLKLLLVGPRKSQFPTFRTVSESSKYYTNLEKWVQKNNLQDSIIFTGAIPYQQIPYYYAACDLFIQPSFLETYGRSLFEAAAVGIPIISQKIGKKQPTYLPKSSAIFLSEMNSDTLQKAIKKILSEPKFKIDAVDSAQHLQTKFNWGKIAKKYLEVYSSVIKN